MKVVKSTHQDRAAGRVNAAAGTKPELWNHPAQAHHQTSYQAPEGPLWVKVGITMTSLGGGGSVSHLTVSLTLFTNTARRKTAAMGGAR